MHRQRNNYGLWHVTSLIAFLAIAKASWGQDRAYSDPVEVRQSVARIGESVLVEIPDAFVGITKQVEIEVELPMGVRVASLDRLEKSCSCIAVRAIKFDTIDDKVTAKLSLEVTATAGRTKRLVTLKGSLVDNKDDEPASLLHINLTVFAKPAINLVPSAIVLKSGGKKNLFSIVSANSNVSILTDRVQLLGNSNYSIEKFGELVIKNRNGKADGAYQQYWLKLKDNSTPLDSDEFLNFRVPFELDGDSETKREGLHTLRIEHDPQISILPSYVDLKLKDDHLVARFLVKSAALTSSLVSSDKQPAVVSDLQSLKANNIDTEFLQPDPIQMDLVLEDGTPVVENVGKFLQPYGTSFLRYEIAIPVETAESFAHAKPNLKVFFNDGDVRPSYFKVYMPELK